MAEIISHAYYSSSDIRHLAATYRRGGLAALQSEIESKANTFQNVKLDIAIMGASGVGKSSFINALRNLDVNDETAAPTGIVETTMECTRYLHPTLPNVTYWDFPGIGSAKLPVKKFLKVIDFSKFDFGIIVCDERFNVEDEILAKKMNKANKPFYFVRTKIDLSIKAESKKTGYNQEQMFQKIRKYCSSSLANVGVKNTHVFLLSNEDVYNYDFPELNRALDTVLPETKKNLFLFALPNTSIDVIERKQELLKRFIHMVATISACIGAVPIPTLSFACDLGLICLGLLFMQKILGLDDASIQKLAHRVGKSEAYLRANIQHPWVYGEISHEQVLTLLERSSIALALTAAEAILDFVPIIGSVFGATSSFWVTNTMLSDSLDEFVQAAKTVMQNAYNLV
ncbi:interferon-inducible GTPase 5-like [Heterodontus francisci]|uniref:interferon-inducible GTPase 5-like n=1 Tax=Heterodontus francisci TaxID=7792 RepID=UPI00355B7178